MQQIWTRDTCITSEPDCVERADLSREGDSTGVRGAAEGPEGPTEPRELWRWPEGRVRRPSTQGYQRPAAPEARGSS